MKSQHAALLTTSIVIALLASWPLWVNTSFYFAGPALQIADFASDDMLVVEAKKLSLLHGHYSRAGFYHPGPFYMYWMAACEWLLHDTLSLFASPAAVQHFAATLLMALAYGSFTFLTTRLSGSALAGGAATAALFGLVYLSTGNVITAPWPPHMLVASGIFTVTGGTGLLLRGWRWLPLLCLGALQLLHGHAIFSGLLPIIVIPTLLMAMRWHGLPSLRSKSLWLAAAIIAVMLAPLAVLTLFNFPEPWASYLRQAGNGEHIAATQAITLLAGFLLPLLAGIALLVAAMPRQTTNTISSLARASGVIFCSGFVAALWFGLRGVDSIDNRYLLFWFAPFSALPGAMAVIALAARLPRFVASTLQIVVIVIAVIACRNSLPWMLFNAAQYAQYQQVWQRLQQQALHGAVQIHTDNRTRYADIWSQVLTFAALSTRAEKPVLCVVASSWHLSYHASTRCAEPTDSNATQILVSAEPAQPGEEQVAEIDGIYYRRIERHTISPP